MHLLHGAVYVHHPTLSLTSYIPPVFQCTVQQFSPHTGNKLYSLAFVCEDDDDPVTRADGEHGEGSESSLELGIAVFAVAEPAKL